MDKWKLVPQVVVERTPEWMRLKREERLRSRTREQKRRAAEGTKVRGGEKRKTQKEKEDEKFAEALRKAGISDEVLMKMRRR